MSEENVDPYEAENATETNASGRFEEWSAFLHSVADAKMESPQDMRAASLAIMKKAHLILGEELMAVKAVAVNPESGMRTVYKVGDQKFIRMRK